MINRLLQTRSKACQKTFKDCRSSPLASHVRGLMEQGKLCEALSDSTAKLCLVTGIIFMGGGCTEDDFNFAKTAVCVTTTPPPPTTASPAATTPAPTTPAPDPNVLLDRLLQTRSKQCQASFSSVGVYQLRQRP